MPRAASGGYSPPGASGPVGTAAGQPSLWASDTGASAPIKSYAEAAPPAAPKLGAFMEQSDVSSPSAFRPTPLITPPKVPAPSTTDVGSLSLNVTSPAGLASSIQGDQQQSNNFFGGLSNALFGKGGLIAGPTDAITGVAGKAVANSPLAPVAGALGAVAKPVGDFVTGAASGPINAVTGAAQNVAGVAGTIATHIPIEAIPPIFGGGPVVAAQVNGQFDAIPDSPEKQQVEQQIANDPLGGGSLKSDFIRQYVAAQQSVNPTLYPELKTAPGSLGDTVVNLLGDMGIFSRPAERAIAGAAQGGGLNRVQQIEAVHDGKMQYTSGTPGNTALEEFVYGQLHGTTDPDGTVHPPVWTDDQALTFLSSNGAGFSHNPLVEVGGQTFLDPTVIGSLGGAEAAKLGETSLKLLDADKAAGAATSLIRDAGSSSRLNVLGKIAETDRAAAAVKTIGRVVYTPLQDSLLGSAAKTVRTIIDPLHAIGGQGPVQAAGVNIASDTATRVMEGAYGELASRQVAADMNKAGLLQDLADAKGTYSANKARELIVTSYVQGLINDGEAGGLAGHVPGEVVGALAHNAPKDWASQLKQAMVSVAKTDWSGGAVSNLGERMSAFFGVHSADEWTALLKDKSTDYLGQLHAATYGKATGEFLDAVGRGTNDIGVQAAAKAKLPRLILLNRETLTDVGAQGILEDIEGAKSADEQVAVIRAAQAQYPSLGYVQLDEANLQTSIEKFVKRLTNNVSDGILPAQLLDREVAKLPTALQDLYTKMSGAFDYGFRPEDDKLWGLGYDGEGRYAMQYTPWVDHVAISNPSYRGIAGLRYNAAGMPIIGEPIGKVLDYIDAGAKTLTARVNSATIQESAKGRFLSLMHETAPGLTPQETRQMFDAISEAAGLHATTPRGLSATNMWDAVKAIVPDNLRLGLGVDQLTPRDVMTTLVHAYEGDLRFVGLTQKLTGKAKTLFAAATGSNFAGQMSENLYQRIKFWANPVFQAQERVEPWVLNAMRGANPAAGTQLNEVDRMAAQEYRNLRDSGVIRATDVDQAEFSQQALVGSGVSGDLARAKPGAWSNVYNVKGAKRVNELRTYQNTLGRTIRQVFDQRLPGTWDKIVAQYSGREGHLVSDGEAATRYLAEQSLANDVTVHSVINPGDGVVAFHNAINSAEWYRGNDLGEIKGLNLDYMAQAMAWPTRDGKTVDSVAKLRAALADTQSGVTIERVQDTLRSYGAHEDYIRRVTNALDFHWDGFWRTTAERFNLKPAETQRLQGLVTESARVRGMTPVDYLSQVVSPMIGGGKDATIESLGSAVSTLRASKGATAEDLAGQLAEIFRHHLDPSGQQGLIDAFERGLPGQIDATMKSGAKVTSQNLQATLSRFEGGSAASGGAVAPAGGASHRIVLGSDLSAVSRPWNEATSRLWKKAVTDRLEQIKGMSAKDVKLTATDPDVERAVRQYAKWSKQVLAGGFLGDEPAGKELLGRLTGIPTEGATPANLMHTLLVNQVTQAQRMAAEDAFRLTYFARNRSFLERSVNHPFFGVYPASYMWGKIAPEMAKFMALEPFGLKTGAGLKAANNFQTSVAVQRELDPAFQAQMDKLGSSSVAWFLGYMLPAVPWDVGAAAPSWARNLATQGLANQQLEAQGKPPKPIQIGPAITTLANYVNPLRPAGQIERPLGELGNLLNGGAPADKAKATSAAKKAAAKQTSAEAAVTRAINGANSAQLTYNKAKTDAGRLTAQRGIVNAQAALTYARGQLQALAPTSPFLSSQPTIKPPAPTPTPAPTATPLQGSLVSAGDQLKSVLFGR